MPEHGAEDERGNSENRNRPASLWGVLRSAARLAVMTLLNLLGGGSRAERRPAAPKVLAEEENKPASAQAAAGHERRDVNVKGLLAFGAVLCVVIALTALGMDRLFRHYASSQPAGLAAREAAAPELPPEPRLEIDMHADLDQLRAHEDQVLHSYGWVDRRNGTVRIPIGRAMELILRQGLPVWQSAPAARKGNDE
jgi:hypothetical protein